MEELIKEFEPSRERSLAVTKLEECQMWLAKCRPTKEALERDQAAPAIVPAFDVATGTFKEDSALD